MRSEAPGRIPAGVVVRGAIEGGGELIVEGRIEGTIDLDGILHLEQNASIQAKVQVRRAIVAGRLEGDLVATESIELSASCRVEGDLRAPRLTIADGASVRGRVELGAAEPAPAPVESTTARAEARAGQASDAPPPMPASALAYGDRRKRIVPASLE